MEAGDPPFIRVFMFVKFLNNKRIIAVANHFHLIETDEFQSSLGLNEKGRNGRWVPSKLRFKMCCFGFEGLLHTEWVRLIQILLPREPLIHSVAGIQFTLSSSIWSDRHRQRAVTNTIHLFIG